MKQTDAPTLSLVPTARPAKTRTTRQTIQILEFIHRFRRVTSHHVQLNLGHTKVTPTNKHLTSLRTQGYIDRQYTTADRTARRWASYYLTPKGRTLLQTRLPQATLRRSRSILADADMSYQQRQRYHTLANAYVYFKRHYDGHLAFSTSVDLVELDYLPEAVPDGYVVVTRPDGSRQHYFLEVYGWRYAPGRQEQRIRSYLQYGDSDVWKQATGQPQPKLLIVAPTKQAQKRIMEQVADRLRYCLTDNSCIFTTTATELTSGSRDIWREVHHQTELDDKERG